MIVTVTPPTFALPDDPDIERQVVHELKRRTLELYRPYPKQRLFHRTGGQTGINARLLMAGNQLGKCSTITSYIEHPDGTRSTCGELYAAGQPFPVYGWTHRLVKTVAVTPIKKPAEPCVRLWTADGRWWEGALNHRVLLASGEYEIVGHLLASWPNLRASTAARDPSTQPSSDGRWWRTPSSFLIGCLQGLRLCDARLHRVLSSVQARLRRQAGVPRHNFDGCEGDAYWSIDTNTDRHGHDLPTNPGAGRRIVARCAAYADQVVRRCAQHTRHYIQAASRRVLAWLLPPQLVDEAPQDSVSQGAQVTPFSVDGNRIIAYEMIPCQEVYDFTVPLTRNYVSAGLVHHNTLSAAAETAMHATGLYPDWWDGKRFKTGIKGWVAGATSQTTRDNPQRLLMGEVGEWGTGMIPERLIVDIKKSLHGVPDAIETVTVKHTSGTVSRLTFKTYDQGRLRWQGETLDLVWYDEEPPIDIYSEGNTRLQVRDGISYMTFTPLLGMSEVVARFLQEKPPGSAVITMTIEEAEHYTPEQRAKIIAGYPAHERDARARGIPMMGSGRVFPIDENLIIETPVEIPPHWPRLAGLDIGWDHPTACVWIAWDRDTDCLHVYDSYKLKEQTPVIHAAAIKGRGVWIPVAWPHDGLQHEKGSGIQIANQYRTQGVNMLRFHATHAPEKGKKEGTGGYSLEAGVSEMLIRMQTSRLKVSMNLNDWREEFRLYHRKDGLIVKKNDDLMSATRVACMMIRHASVQVFRSTAPKLKGFRQTDRGMGVLG